MNRREFVRMSGLAIAVANARTGKALAAGDSGGVSYYVALSGDDGNAGTESKPFKTIERAREAVRTQNKNMRGDILVNLRGGTYPIRKTIVFDARDSGSNGYKVIYRSYPGEKAEICGGKRISGWQRESGGRWRATTDIDDFRQLYVNGTKARRARGGPLTGAELLDGNGYKIPDASMASWKNQSDIEFVYDHNWERVFCKVAGIKKQSGGAVIRMLQPYFTLARIKDGVRVDFPVYVENAFELLNEPGEWYLDQSTHTVYYIPRSGENMERAEVIAPAVETLVELRGTLDSPVHDIEFEGIIFCHASWLRPSRIGLIDVQANFCVTPQNLIARSECHVANLHNENLKSPSNVILHAAKSVRFERCTFTKFGCGGLDVEYGSQDNMISGCIFHDLAGSGIQVGGVVHHHPRDPREIVKGNQVVNSYIHDVATEYIAGVGIFLGYTDGTVLAHNEISNLPYTGITMGWGWGEEDPGGGAYYQPFFYKTPTPSRNHHCESNHIHDVMLQRFDGGAIYTLGDMPGTVIQKNLIHDNKNMPGGIYLDEGSGYIEVTKNVVYNVLRAMNYNNHNQNRIATCHEHDNYFDIKPGNPNFPKEIADQAGLEPKYKDLLRAEKKD